MRTQGTILPTRDMPTYYDCGMHNPMHIQVLGNIAKQVHLEQNRIKYALATRGGKK